MKSHGCRSVPLAMLLISHFLVVATVQELQGSTASHKFSIYLKDESNNGILHPSQKLLSANASMSVTAFNSSSTPSPCSCSTNGTDAFLAKAQIMMDAMVNKTSMLSKIRHRATHSNEAVWASFTLSGLMVLLVVGVLQSKMWNDRTYISYPESQPVKFEQFNPKSEILVKELIRSRGRNLVTFFSRRRRKACQKNTLQMETFLSREGDTVDSNHKALLESSSEEENLYMESDESEEETIFKINSRTGQWEGETDDDVTRSLLGARKRNRESTSSTESRYSNSMINSAMAKDLLRLSDSDIDGEEEKQLIKVG